MCDTNGKQLSGSRVNKGFPYMEYDTEPLFGQTEPLRTPNTQNHCVPLAGAPPPNHCVTLMENNSQGPVLIRVSPYMGYHTKPL